MWCASVVFNTSSLENKHFSYFTILSLSSGLNPFSIKVEIMFGLPLLYETATCNAVCPWNEITDRICCLNID